MRTRVPEVNLMNAVIGAVVATTCGRHRLGDDPIGPTASSAAATRRATDSFAWWTNKAPTRAARPAKAPLSRASW